MENLNLDFIAPYFPHGLFFWNELTEKQWAALSIAKDSAYIQTTDKPKTPQEPLRTIIPLGRTTEFKIILRSLSDITNEIEIQGVKFIPLIEIAKLTEPDFKWFIEDGHAFHNLNDSDYYEFWYDNLLEVFRFEYIFGGFNGDNEPFIKYPNSQIKSFNMLYKWHFDTKGLIDKGLAVDINNTF